ncbi:MAG: hypothetical protein QOK42_2432 [Frankiaceae bacterium]|nr:hypothetical protein [Frankiaceae bacterium]
MSDNPWATQPVYRPPTVTKERLKLSDAWAALVTTAVLVLLGAPVGLLWGALAPRVAVVKVAQGIDLQMPETKAFVAADGSFLVIALLVGVACGVAAALIGRRHAPGVAIGLAVGGVLAALIAMKVGHRLGYESYAQLRDVAKVGTRGSAYLQLRAKGVLLAWPAAASLALLTVTAGRRPAPAQPPVA